MGTHGTHPFSWTGGTAHQVTATQQVTVEEREQLQEDTKVRHFWRWAEGAAASRISCHIYLILLNSTLCYPVGAATPYCGIRRGVSQAQ